VGSDLAMMLLNSSSNLDTKIEKNWDGLVERMDKRLTKEIYEAHLNGNAWRPEWTNQQKSNKGHSLDCIKKNT
jgi:hypothetical protein